MGKRGTKPHTAAQLKVHGTYRADRHSARGGEALPDSKPDKPDNLGAHGEWLWDHVVKTRGQWIDAGDRPKLQHMCEVWDLMQRTLKALDDDATDKNARCAYSNYASLFTRLSACFGLSPGDRANLPAVDAKPKSVASRFLA